MYLEIFYPPQKKAFHIFEQKNALINEYKFFLAGGTALALQIGHRRSIDFDFFSPLGFEPSHLFLELLKMFPGSKLQKEGGNTLTLLWEEVQLSFFGGITLHHLKPPITIQAFPMFSIPDIAAMKMAAMIQRTALRDYFDIAYLLNIKALSLSDIIDGFYKKYGEQGETYPVQLLIKTLTYVDDLPSDTVEILKGRDFWKRGDLKKKMKKILDEKVKDYLLNKFTYLLCS